MKDVIIYFHGKGGSAEEAEHYRSLCPGYEVLGMDYSSDLPWENREEIAATYDRAREKYDKVVLIANSIGAFFAMHALQDRKAEKALLISPVVNMEKLIGDMMGWAGVTEAELREKQEIETSFGETLSWKYLCYVREHPIRWNCPTEILYAEKDNLTSFETVSVFAERWAAR